MKKRILCLVLVVCMIVFAFAACSGSTSTETTGTEQSEENSQAQATASTGPADEFVDTSTGKYDDVEAPDGFTIGFVYLPPSDTLSAAFQKVLDYTAAEFGCTMKYGEVSSAEASEWLSAYENLIQAGVQGMLCVVVTGGIIDTFDTNGVYWAQLCWETDSSLKEQALASPYFCGNIGEDEVTAGYALGQSLYNAGCRNIAYMSQAAGVSTSHDDRVRGIEQFAEEHDDFTIVASSRDAANTSSFDEMIAANGAKIDGIALTGGNSALPAAIIAAGYEDSIKYATIDIQGDVRTDLEDGLCVGVGAGQYPDMALGFALLYNALASDTTIMPDLGTTLKRPYMWITNAEEYDQYITYMEGEIPAYTGDEIKDLCVAYNSDATIDQLGELLAEYCENYSLEDVVSRHADLF